MSVTAVVLTLDGRGLLEGMLPTLVAQDVPDLRVVVLDDGSADGTPEWLAECWPQVEVAVNETNLGVARSFNRAVELARGSDYLALLNNDLELAPDYVSRLVAALDAHPETASANGKMRNYRDRALLDGAGDAFMWSSIAIRRGWGQPDSGQFDAPCEVFSACGGAAVYRMAAFEDVGGFDEDFHAYLEDIDWGFRAQLRGWTARYVPGAEVFHVGGATTARNARFFGRLQRRNTLLLIVKDYPLAALLRHAPQILVHHAGWLVASMRDGVASDHLRAWAEALRMLPATLRKRRAIQAGRRVDVARLDSVMSPEPWAGLTLRERLAWVGRAIRPVLRLPGRR
jgi:GT2 family glycosyltransferase